MGRFDKVFDAILELNDKYLDMYDKLVSASHPAYTDDKRDAFMSSFDKDYEKFWNNGFSSFSKEERKILEKMLNSAGKLKEKIYSEMEFAYEFAYE